MNDVLTTAVTGAFSYSGRAITAELKARGRRVRTLTGHPDRARPDSGGPDEVCPLDFQHPADLRRSLTGTDTLINTYWVRFPHAGSTFTDAVDNSRTLFDAALQAGVRRIVHISITHADPALPYPYFAGKGLVEQHLMASPISHAILRPAILFGGKAVLINNIAWLLRRLPVFAVGGHGSYRIRAIHIDDLARLCADEAESDTNVVRDAVGPERPTFRELVEQIRDAVGSRSIIMSTPGVFVPICAAGIGAIVGDVLLTHDEYASMAAGLADTSGPATGGIALSAWLAENGSWLGRSYLKDSRGPHPRAAIARQ